MSGKGSRERRKEAVCAARDAVYQRNGAPYDPECNPFADERRRDIFRKTYLAWELSYHRNEALLAELTEVYGSAQ